MRLTKNQLQFIINCDVERLVELLQQERGMSMLDAFDCVYNSRIYKKLINTDTGLYIQSAEYIYDYLEKEIGQQA